MSSPAESSRAERRRYAPERSFALRLRAAHGGQPGELAGQLEHVMSGRCTDFANAEQLLQALTAWSAEAAPGASASTPSVS